jgi:hypothetical protein
VIKLKIKDAQKGRKKDKMTNYYFLKTNAYNCVYATDGKRFAECPSNGAFDINSGIDLYADNAIELLKTAYAKIDGLMTMDEIANDLPHLLLNGDPLADDDATADSDKPTATLIATV